MCNDESAFEAYLQWHRLNYIAVAVDVANYRRHMCMRSPRWATVTLPRAVYHELVKPLFHFTHRIRPVGYSLEL